MKITSTSCLAAVCLAAGSLWAQPREKVEAPSEELYLGQKTLRQFDCARCHGGNYEGMVGPSLMQSVSQRSPEEFNRLLLEGNVTKGMPAYAEVEKVAKNAEAIRAYLKARAEGEVGDELLTPPGGGEE